MAAALELQPSTNVRDMVDCVREAAERFHIVSLNRQIEVCEGLLSRNPLIDVAILGQFKAGRARSSTASPVGTFSLWASSR